MLKKVLIIPIVAIFVFTMMNTAPLGDLTIANAKDESSIKSEIQSTKDKKAEADKKYEAAKAKEEELEAQITAIEAKIKETEETLTSLEGQIVTTTNNIEKVKLEIQQMEAELEQQNEDLSERLRMMYESGDGNLVDVLLGSSTFVDFMASLEMVQLIHEYDMKILDEINAQLQAIEDKKVELDTLQKDLEQQKKEQEEKRATMADDKEVLAKAESEAHKDTLEAYAESKALEGASRSLEAELKAMQSSGQISSGSQKYTGGEFGWPANGPITSRFGNRNSPGGIGSTNHKGIDIGVPTGSPIYAAAEGTVISAGWNSGGYGNLVSIDHGGGITTHYAHNSAILVSVGSKVSKGDQIAKAGSTGNSTGPHCHFEVRVNGTAQNPLAWLN